MTEEQKNKLETLLPFQQRMVKEYEDLTDKVAKLEIFTDGDIFKGLEICEQSDMLIQLHAMTAYRLALMSRLRRSDIFQLLYEKE